jgi:hypothetical protein
MANRAAIASKGVLGFLRCKLGNFAFVYLFRFPNTETYTFMLVAQMVEADADVSYQLLF